MTLSTKMIICQPVPPKQLWDFTLDLLTRDERMPKEKVAYEYIPVGEHTFPSGHKGYQEQARFGTIPDQGLPAWTFLFHADDGPLKYWDAEEIEEVREIDGDPDWEPPWFNEHYLRFDFDTGYGYTAPNGAHCGDLHAWLVTEVAQWLAERGVTKVVWQLEYDGTWHEITEIHRLGDPERGAL